MILPVLLACAALLIGLTVLAPRLDMLRSVLADLGERSANIDGLRGICALAVAAHHLSYFSYWSRRGEWRMAPADHALETLGKTGVALFFLICAYLFWGKLSSAARAGRATDFRELLRNRMRRLGPMYLCAMTGAVMIVGLWGEGLSLNLPRAYIGWQTIQAYTFGFLGLPRFNDSFIAFAAISVTWSLTYEWSFYLSLPALEVLRAPARWGLVVVLGLATNAAVLHIPYLDYFFYGAAAYELSRSPELRKLLTHPLLDGLSLTLVSLVVLTVPIQKIGSGAPALMLFAGFLPIAAGASWFGVLRTSGARVVGGVSYSLYLLNIVIFWVLWRATGLFSPEAPLAGPAVAGGLAIALAVSLLGYRYVERPYMLASSRTLGCPGRQPANA